MNLTDALLPAFALIAAGYVLRRIGLPGPGFWSRAEKLTYYLFLPALLVHNLASASFADFELGPSVIAVLAAVLLMSAAVLALRPLLPIDGPAFSSVYQGALRPNIYVALSAAAGLYAQAGLTQAAVVTALLVPLGNVLSVFVLGWYAHPDRGVGRALGAVARNPMVLACAAGIGMNALGWRLPGPGMELLGVLGQAALPIGLLAVGAGLHLEELRHAHGVVLLTTALKLLVFPLLTWGVCRAVGLDTLATVVTVAFAAVPGSGSAYVLAGQLGGNQRLLAAMISLQVPLAALTMPLLLWVAGR